VVADLELEQRANVWVKRYRVLNLPVSKRETCPLIRLRHSPGPPGRAGPGPVFSPVRAYNVKDQPGSPEGC
jgi:hypothetical protein